MKGPVFLLFAVCTIDGKIARHSRHMTDWSSKEDKNFLHKMLDKSDVVIIGKNTYLLAKKPLSKRNCIVLTSSVKNPTQINKKLVYLNPAHSSIVRYCKKYSCKKVAVLGGRQTFNYFLKKGLVDEIFLTIEPLVFGSGFSLFTSGSKDVFFDLILVKKLNAVGTVLLRYRKR